MFLPCYHFKERQKRFQLLPSFSLHECLLRFDVREGTFDALTHIALTQLFVFQTIVIKNTIEPSPPCSRGWRASVRDLEFNSRKGEDEQ